MGKRREKEKETTENETVVSVTSRAGIIGRGKQRESEAGFEPQREIS